MVPNGSPALRPARALARANLAPIHPVDPDVRGALSFPDGAVLLVDHAPTDELLSALAAALRLVTALVLWAPGWDEPTTVEALATHAFEHGSVDITAEGALCVLASSAESAAAATAALKDERPQFRVLAVIPAFNEADVIYHSIGALIAEGVDVYLIDHESTDGTAEAARPWLDRGLVHIERFPEDAGYPERNRREMVWRDILSRVQDVSEMVSADWYVFSNADEFRESPWPGVTLAEGLREVGELGYNAVNFELFDFRPVDDSFVPGDDPRNTSATMKGPCHYDFSQIKAWKCQPGPVDLVPHGGHDLLFDGKRVFQSRSSCATIRSALASTVRAKC